MEDIADGMHINDIAAKHNRIVSNVGIRLRDISIRMYKNGAEIGNIVVITGTPGDVVLQMVEKIHSRLAPKKKKETNTETEKDTETEKEVNPYKWLKAGKYAKKETETRDELSYLKEILSVIEDMRKEINVLDAKITSLSLSGKSGKPGKKAHKKDINAISDDDDY